MTTWNEKSTLALPSKKKSPSLLLHGPLSDVAVCYVIRVG